jgi:hypothetical protein
MRYAMIAGALALLLSVGVAQGTTDVHQKYRLLGLTESGDDDVFWILEDTSGEGMGSRIVQVVLGQDHQPVLVETWFRHFGTWQWMVDGFGAFETQAYAPLMEGQGLFMDLTAELLVREPPPDTLAFREYQRYVYAEGGTLPGWNAAKGASGVRSPTIDGYQSELLYWYPNGLYISYHFSEVFYFPYHRYLVVFTHQDELGLSFDTMHGFIILRISRV